ncbi:hypothetical protein EB796_020691 [Bugula neritina]|uniref:Uncharacterized protein n=1 Tax=Bugula neritina TaxID=10212 RepID=A0A7J7J5P5_BUGNE|nr:hypothetical protein EB796_020691 [Bugula neritina]
MIDYERYDHTYCRVVAAPSDVITEKVNYTLPADDILIVNNYAMETTVSTEKENGTQPAREPVILSRGKRPRKTNPIIVKAVNKDGDSLRVSTVVAPVTAVSSNSSHSIVRKAAPPANDTGICEDKTDNKNLLSTTGSSSQIKISADNNGEEKAELSKNDDLEEDLPQEPVVPPTKSGRMRKLTAKAKENSEWSKASKNSKAQKIKKSLEKPENAQRRRGRPPTKKPSAVSVSPSDNAPEVVTDLKEATVSHESNKAGTKNSTETVVDASKFATNQKPATGKKRGRKPKMASPQSETPAISVKPAKPTVGRPKLAPVVKQPAVKKNKKQSSKPAKLVVVTKPPPKRRAQQEAAPESQSKVSRKRKQMSNNDHSIPSAKIDTRNIMGGSRRKN